MKISHTINYSVCLEFLVVFPYTWKPSKVPTRRNLTVFVKYLYINNCMLHNICIYLLMKK